MSYGESPPTKNDPLLGSQAFSEDDDDDELLIDLTYRRNDVYTEIKEKREDTNSMVSSSRYRKTALCLLSIVIMLERVAFFNIYSVLTKELLGKSDSVSDKDLRVHTESFLFAGVSYFLPVFGGMLTCGLIGRYWSVIVGNLMYLIGAIILTIDCPLFSYTYPLQLCNWKQDWLAIPFILVALGGAFMKTALYNLFVQHATHGMTKELHTLEKPFSWIYGMYTLGELISYTIALSLAQRQLNPMPFAPPLLGTGSLLIAFVLFMAGTRLYIKQDKKPYVLIGSARLVSHRLVECCRRVTGRRNHGYMNPTTQWTSLRRQIEIGLESATAVKQVGHVLPVFGALLAYYSIMPQVTYVLRSQLAGNCSKSSALPIDEAMEYDDYYFTLAILLGLYRVVFGPLFYFIAQPVLRRYKMTPSFYQKIGVSTTVLGICLAVGFAVEATRMEGLFNFSMGSCIAYEATQSGIFYFSELICTTSACAFSYLEAPVGLEDFFLGLYLCTCGSGFLLGILMVHIFSATLVSDLKAHSEYYVLVLTVFLILTAILIVFLSHKHPLDQSGGSIGSNGLSIQPNGRSVNTNRQDIQRVNYSPTPRRVEWWRTRKMSTLSTRDNTFDSTFTYKSSI